MFPEKRDNISNNVIVLTTSDKSLSKVKSNNNDLSGVAINSAKNDNVVPKLSEKEKGVSLLFQTLPITKTKWLEMKTQLTN